MQNNIWFMYHSNKPTEMQRGELMIWRCNLLVHPQQKQQESCMHFIQYTSVIQVYIDKNHRMFLYFSKE